MITHDTFTQYYTPLLRDTYDVVDRIVINAHNRFASSPGGFRNFWYDLFGNFDKLDDTHLMRMAGRFSRRVRGWAGKHKIPVIYCKGGERKHDIAEQYIPKDPEFTGIFLVIVSRIPVPTWCVLRFESGEFHIKHKEPMPFANHYFFHIMDKDWGHVTIAMSGHPPFRSLIMLNGHEFTACLARKKQIKFVKDGNCFVEMSSSRKLAEVADTLRTESAIGQLRQVCDRWVYTCLSFGLSFEEQKRSRFRFDYSVYQMEYSRNLLFRNGRQMERVFDGVVDRTRHLLDMDRVLKIFGRHKRRFRRVGESYREELSLEMPEYDLTVFKLHFGKMTLKLYTKGECVLRSEAIAHHVGSLNTGCLVERFCVIIEYLERTLTRFLESMQCIDTAWVWEGQLDELPKSGKVGRTRVGGIDVNKPRIRSAMAAAVALSFNPSGFTAAEHSKEFKAISGKKHLSYTARKSAYDLKKFRGKGLLQKTSENGHKYRLTAKGFRVMAGLYVLRERVLEPLLHGLGRCKHGFARGDNPLNTCYREIQHGMQKLFKQMHFIQSDSYRNVLHM